MERYLREMGRVHSDLKLPFVKRKATATIEGGVKAQLDEVLRITPRFGNTEFHGTRD